MRITTVIFVAIGLSCVPVYGAQLTQNEKKVYACILNKMPVVGGNPVVAAHAAVELCPTDGLKQNQIERLVGKAIRKEMKDLGMKCIGTGCG